jgi:hypothetical protein
MLRIDGERRARLMEAVDGINRKHGRHTVRPLAMGQDQGWEMKRGRTSRRTMNFWVVAQSVEFPTDT